MKFLLLEAPKKFFALLFAALAPSEAYDWPRWRGPDGTGVIPDDEYNLKALASGPKIRWKASLGVGHSSVAIVGMNLYTMGNQGGQDIVYCFEFETGKEVWRHSYPCPPGDYSGPRASAVVDDGLVYTLSQQGQAFCLDAETGKVTWQKDLIKEFGAQNIQWGMAGSPLVVGDVVIYNACSSGLALNKKSGEKVWASPSGKGGYASPVFFKYQGKSCVAIFGAKELAVVDYATGKSIYTFPWETKYDVNAADPVYFDGKILLSSGYDRGCVLLGLSSGKAKPLWENKNLNAHFASPIFFKGAIYGVDGQTGQGQLVCLDPATGKVLWAQKGKQENFMIAGGRILAIDKAGVLSVCDAVPSGYKELARGTVLSAKAKNWTAPVLSSSLVYCRNSEGELVCVDLR